MMFSGFLSFVLQPPSPWFEILAAVCSGSAWA